MRVRARARIAEGLRHLAMPLELLVSDSGNVRRHGERNMRAIRDSLRRFGQRLPLVVQRREGRLVVRAGNARLRAMREMGWREAAAVVVEEGDREAVAFALADNRTAELAEWDEGGLLARIRELEGAVPVEEVGFDPVDVRRLELWSGLPEDNVEIDEGRLERGVEETRCPRCGYSWQTG